ncbi:MAG: prepilin-type N-terminal cleavage/methylation domain-containing protein [Candidatus Omnitrophica bacterium]|nr:prepilin-type N-terminal cleavage/methylation domain-containing protein [Candidatus Omnitrophota bacterium]
MRKFKAGFGFIEILLVLAIIAFIAYKVFNVYFKKTSLDKETQKIISEQGIDTTSYKSTIDSTRDKLKDIQSNRTAQ